MSPSLRAVLVALVVSAVIVGAAPSLSVKTSIPNVEVDGLENLKVTATVFNTGDETLKLINDPRGVLSSVPENSFTITNPAGSRPSFNGAKVAYSPRYIAGLNDPGVFTVLAPDASIDVIHDLSNAYNFTRSGAGNYSIEPSDLFTYLDTDGTLKDLYATVEDVAEVKLSGNLAVSRVHDKRGNYQGCTTDNKRVIAAAASRAQEHANNAYYYIASLSKVTPRYKLWFGAYTDSRKRTVENRFRSINSYRFSDFTYNCNLCNSLPQSWKFNAFVDPKRPGFIHLCPRFWESPETGAGSKVGTLIHEVSHFTGTLDLESRGEESCSQLAILDPDNAINNADNYAFFAEDAYQID